MSENQPTDYEKDSLGQHQRWVVEFAAARKALEQWQSKGEEIDKEFRNELTTGTEFDTRLPLFTSDVQTMIAMLYGQVPRCSVSRRFGDSDDDLARVAGEILERILNTDISRDSDTYAVALRCVLMDYFLPGFGQASCRYVTGEIVKEDVAAEMGEDGSMLVEAYSKESRPKEDVEIDYAHWRDWMWGPAKVLHLVPWWAKCSDMSRAQLVERFGAAGKLVPLKKGKNGEEDPWSRAQVWEIWERETKKVYWFCEAHGTLLDMKEDPLGLEGFYPFPEPLVANLTTSKVVPRPYYALHQDQYRQINKLMSRIRELVEAVRVSGVYDAANKEDLLTFMEPQSRFRLIPVRNFGAWREKGGMAGVIDWFPIEMVVQAITVLQGQLVAEIDLLHQATGFADIMRGEATQAGATATEQRVKARTGSVRVQRLQDEIARFATNLLKVKAEIVAKHFSPETIYARANVRFMAEEDQALAQEAIALLKSDIACYRVEVKPEAVALADFAATKQERAEALETLVTFFQATAPIAQQFPATAGGFLEMAKWMVAGVRGSSEMEGIFDRMIQQAEQAAAQPQQQKPDPKMQAEQMKLQGAQLKAQADLSKEQMKHQNKLVEIQAETAAHDQQEQSQAMWNTREAAQKGMIQRALKPPEAPKPGGFPR